MNEERAIRSYKKVVRLMELQRRMVDELSADEDVSEAYGAILRHLNKLSRTRVLQLFSVRSQPERAGAIPEDVLRRADQMSLDDVEIFARDPRVTRAILEAIAVGRFGVPQGSLRSLGNMEQLRDRVLTFVENEKAHQRIATLAKDSK